MRGLSERLKLICIIAATLVLVTLILLHTPGIDGPWYSHYGWHRAQWRTFAPLMLASALPIAIALLLFEWRRLVIVPLLLGMCSVAAISFIYVLHLRDDLSFRRMYYVVRN